MALFSFIGVEAAAVTAKRVRDPRRNVGRASMIGTALSAMLYVLVTAAVMGLVAHHTLVNTGSPFVNAFQSIFPHERLGREVHRRRGRHLGHRRPQRLDPDRHRDVAGHRPRRPVPPAVRLGRPQRHGLVRHRGRDRPAVAAHAVALQHQRRAHVFTYLVDLTVVTVAIPYFFSAIAQLTYLVSRRRRVQGWLLARDLSVAGASVLFSMWVTFASGYQVVYQALVVILAGLILYAFLNARRQRLGETAEPVDLTTEEPAAELVRRAVTAPTPDTPQSREERQ